MPTTPDRRELKRRLDSLVDTADVAARRELDPVGFVHEYPSSDDAEIVALVASSLAFGQVVTIRRNVRRVLLALGAHPARTVDSASEAELASMLEGFVHRVYRGPDVACMLANAGAMRRQSGSLGAAFAMHLEATDGDLRESLARFADSLRGGSPARGLRHLVPDPRSGSAVKRLLLFLRWMVRPADGVDLGLWPVSPSLLVIPVDTHVHRIARNLGLTTRGDASWRTAVEITDALRVLDPDDPVRYDFAICHLGVSRACPSRRDPSKCDACALRPVCTVWSVRSARTAKAAARAAGARRASAPSHPAKARRSSRC